MPTADLSRQQALFLLIRRSALNSTSSIKFRWSFHNLPPEESHQRLLTGQPDDAPDHDLATLHNFLDSTILKRPGRGRRLAWQTAEP